MGLYQQMVIEKDIENIPQPSLSQTFTVSANANPTFNISDIGLTQKPGITTSHLARDGTRIKQSGTDIKNTQRDVVSKKADIQSQRHVLNDQMNAVKDVVRDSVVSAAVSEGISRGEILGAYAKPSPEIDAAVDVFAPMSVQIAQTVLDVYRDRKSLTSKQVTKIANKAASIINEKAPQNKQDSHFSKPVSEDFVQDMMNEKWSESQAFKQLDFAEADLNRKEVSIAEIDEDLDKGNIIDTDPNFATDLMHNMGDNLLSISGVPNTFGISHSDSQKVQRAYDAQNGANSGMSQPNLDAAFSMST